MKSAASEGYSRVEFVTTSSRRGKAKKTHNNSDIIGMGDSLDPNAAGDRGENDSDASSKMTQINLISGRGPPPDQLAALPLETT